MAPTEEDRFAAAERLWASGDGKTAVAEHVDLMRRGQNPELRLRSALILVERVNPGWNVDVILEACLTGIEMTEKLGETSTRTYLMGVRAKTLAVWSGSLVTARKNLKMGPGWLGFSLERDEEQRKSLSTLIEANEKEVERLTHDAQKESGDPATLGHVLCSMGNISFQRYLNRKCDSLQKLVRLPSFLRELLRSYALDEYLWYSLHDRQTMRTHLNKCERRYSEAVMAFRAAGDEVNVAYAFYAMANDLRSANRFRKAMRYLRQAETIARRLNDLTLLGRIPVLKERIRQRNRNVPNYVAGEGDTNK
jgi:hypothetical protein